MAKLIIISDIHGYSENLEDTLKRFPNAKIIIAGDILAFGEGNPHKNEYRPDSVIKLLNRRYDDIFAVRGNCDSEADQDKLEFDFYDNIVKKIKFEERKIYITHGDHYSEENLPDGIVEGDVLITGHTHVPRNEVVNGILMLNPGSISQPRQENKKASYALYDDGEFHIKYIDAANLKNQSSIK